MRKQTDSARSGGEEEDLNTTPPTSPVELAVVTATAGATDESAGGGGSRETPSGDTSEATEANVLARSLFAMSNAGQQIRFLNP